MSNIETVKAVYAAFGRGDIPAILEHVAADVEWEYAYANVDHSVPWLVHGRGRQHVARFFQRAAEHLEFIRFEVTALLAKDDLVIALAQLEARVKSTGKTIREIDEPHIWRFDERGRVARFRHASDTLGQLRALER